MISRYGCAPLSFHARVRPQLSPGIRNTRRTDLLCSSGSGTTVPSDLALKIAQHHYEVQTLTRSYSAAVKDFTDNAILAYECGYSQTTLKEELSSFPSKTQVANKVFNQAECLEHLALVWATLMISPRTVKRWSTGPALDPDTLGKWQGFVTILVNAYFEKRMAWYSVDRLQLELKMVGVTERAEVVAERMRLVFTVLETVYPQFPSI